MLHDTLYKKILSVCILVSIVRLIYKFDDNQSSKQEVPIWGGLLSGATIGLLSGMIGIGGGIILSPLMLLMRWSNLKETAAVSALFIFVNSLSGLFGLLQKGGVLLPEEMQWAILATVVGGLIGSYFGSQRFNNTILRKLLAVSLIIASLKLIFT